MGPKPATYIDIVGIEGEYVAAFVAKEARGPNMDYEDWLHSDQKNPEYHPIIEYKDNEGYKWIERYFMCNGDSQIKYTYYAPNEFKIVIYKNTSIPINKATKIKDTINEVIRFDNDVPLPNISLKSLAKRLIIIYLHKFQ